MSKIFSFAAAVIAVIALVQPSEAAIFGSRSVSRVVVRQPVVSHRQRVVVQQQIVAAPVVVAQPVVAVPQFVAPVYSGAVVAPQVVAPGCNSFFAR